MRPEDILAAVSARIEALPRRDRRRLVAIAGPPASGKSTLAESLAETLPDARMVPMDGFHLDNRLLIERGLLARKGAPETFDVDGFRCLLNRLHTDDEVIYPLFDRALDRAIAGAGCVDRSVRTIIVEGNYLLLDADGWRELKPLWDFSVYLTVPETVLRERLMQRWSGYGFSHEDAARKVDGNDLPNAATIDAHLMSPDMVVQESG